ncbi:class I SAM-dependent methyltransferase [Verrucomicrobiota bacterium]
MERISPLQQSYKRDAHHYSLYTRIAADHVFRILSDLQEGGKALDVGCGTGYLMRRISETWPGRWDLHGIESDQCAIDWLRSCASGTFALGDARDIQYEDGTFDLVLSISVLEHIEDDTTGMRELVRVLKPGGVLIVSVPCLNGVRSRSRLRNLGHTDPGNPEYHVRPGYDADDLAGVLDGMGLSFQMRFFGMFLLSEILMDLVKWAYFRAANTLGSQTNIAKAGTSRPFALYKCLFPLIYGMEIVERGIFRGSEKGHIFTAAFRRTP